MTNEISYQNNTTCMLHEVILVENYHYFFCIIQEK